jgi:hypothetical protein
MIGTNGYHVFDVQVHAFGGDQDPHPAGPVVPAAFCGWELPDEDAAGRLYDALCAGTAETAERSGMQCSIWRTTTTSRSPWYVLACGDPEDLALVIAVCDTWPDAMRFDAGEDTAWMFCQRRFTAVIDAIKAGELTPDKRWTESRHFDGGAVLRADGRYEIQKVES